MQTKREVTVVNADLAALYHEAGFGALADTLASKLTLQQRTAGAYEHFPYVTLAQVRAFNRKLRRTTQYRTRGFETRWKELAFTAPSKFTGEPPPPAVLAKLKDAISLKVFDSFEVAHVIEQERYSPPRMFTLDPILFGCIKGCSDRFFIAQWGNDVSLEDLTPDMHKWESEVRL